MRNRVYDYPIGSDLNQHKYESRLYDPVTIAVVTAATIGTSVYTAQQQKKASERASEAQRRAEMDARRIAAEKKPMEESATLKTNALDAGVDPVTSLNLLVDPMQRPKKSTGLGAQMSSTGLGFGS